MGDRVNLFGGCPVVGYGSTEYLHNAFGVGVVLIDGLTFYIYKWM